MSGANLNATGWIMVPATDDPNPVVGERYASDGGIARLYANGKIDAIDGIEYSLSPGFDSFKELECWIGGTAMRASRVSIDIDGNRTEG